MASELQREIDDFIPVAIIGLLLWGGYKVLTGIPLPASPSSPSAPSAPAPSPPTGGQVPCTKNGTYWTQQTDGSYYGRPYCAPGVPCPQNIQITRSNPC